LAQEKLFDPYDDSYTYAQPLDESDKEELLFEVREAIAPTSRLQRTTLLVALLTLVLLASIVMPKIFLRNALYYDSRDVVKLEHEYDTLQQENERLQEMVETMRYKNQIEDTLF